jgi:hypothetical protein
MNESKKVIDDPGDGNIINIKFVPLNKKEQQVKRAFKLGQSYLVGCTHRFA